MKTDKELKKIAADYVDGLIFSNLETNNEPATLQSVFFPLVLGGEEIKKFIDKEKPHFIYEYYSKAGPKSINGRPWFLSMRVLNGKSYKKFIKYVNKFAKQRNEFYSDSWFTRIRNWVNRNE